MSGGAEDLANAGFVTHAEGEGDPLAAAGKPMPLPDDDGDDERDDSPYCDCGNIPYEDEEASNRCSACGKRLE